MLRSSAPLRARRLRHRGGLAWPRTPRDHAGLALARRAEANVHLLCSVPRRAGSLHLVARHSRRPDRERSEAPRAAHLLRAHLFGTGPARAHHQACRRRGAQGAARHLAQPEPRREPARDRGGAQARPPASRRGRGFHRRQRGAAQGRALCRQHRGLHGRGEAPVRPSRHLCRCVGVLAQGARARLGGRLRDHPYPALLGGRSRRGFRGGRPCARDQGEASGEVRRQGDLDRGGRLAERGADARGRAALSRQSGAGSERRGGGGQGRKAGRSI